MALITQHPLYRAFHPDWETMRDTYAGERAVKERGQKYLAPTQGMVKDGLQVQQGGLAAYQAYRSRAIFHDFVREGVEYYIGLMHQKPPKIDLPSALEPLRLNATLMHESLEQLLRRINEQQLVAGRYGMMLDIPQTPEPGHDLPYIATYMAESITNWDVGTRAQIDLPELNLVVLNESTFKRTANGFEWEYIQQYRVLTIGDVEVEKESGLYRQALFSGMEAQYDASKLEAPSIKGKTLEHIPFVFVNSTDTLPQPDICPLLGLAKLALAVYRGEADYRQNLFMQGQDTLVIIGSKDDDEVRMGAGSVVRLRAGPGVDAKFIGVTATGLAEQRQALENDKTDARNKSGQLIDTRSSQKESGEALEARVAAQTATLNTIASTGARALEQLLKAAATWVGANPDEVKVQPNKEFTQQPWVAADFTALQTAKTLGAPIAQETIHEIMVQRGMSDKTYEEEMALIADEAPIIGTGTTAGGNPVTNPKEGKPMIDPKTGKPVTQPGGTAEHPDAVNARASDAAGIAAVAKLPTGAKPAGVISRPLPATKSPMPGK
jgi:uncharacterized protein DUF4055